MPRFAEAPLRYSYSAHRTHPTTMQPFLQQHRRYMIQNNNSSCAIHITMPPNATPNGILTTTGRWSCLPGHTLHHGTTQRPQFIQARLSHRHYGEIALLAHCRGTIRSIHLNVKVATVAISTPWSLTNNPLPLVDFWRTILDTDLPKGVCNINYELGHYLVPIRPAGQGRQVCRHCSQNAATPMLETPEHIVLHCDAMGRIYGPL